MKIHAIMAILALSFSAFVLMGMKPQGDVAELPPGQEEVLPPAIETLTLMAAVKVDSSVDVKEQSFSATLLFGLSNHGPAVLDDTAKAYLTSLLVEELKEQQRFFLDFEKKMWGQVPPSLEALYKSHFEAELKERMSYALPEWTMLRIRRVVIDSYELPARG